MKRILGPNNQGIYGDLVLQTKLPELYKIINGPCHITYAINQRCKDIVPLFKNHPFIDDTLIYDGYDNWPTEIDRKLIQGGNFDQVFHPMARHKDPQFWLRRHQIEACCDNYDLDYSLLPDLQIRLTKYWESRKFNKTVAFCPFGATRGSEKSLTIEKGIEIIELLKKLGYSVIQLGGINEFKFDLYNYENNYTCYSYNGKLTFFESVKYALNCDFLLSVDTGLIWAASGYQHPTLGLYNVSYYAGAANADNWTPINSNLIKLEDSKNLNEININLIEESIKNLV